MSKLEIQYAWSDSRLKTFRECKYRYYLTYFLAFEGWLASAAPEKQQAYLLKNMTNLAMFAGTCVHNTLEKIIKGFRDTGIWIGKQEAINMAVDALRIGWKQSEQKKWQENVKNNVNLAEHFYNEVPTKDQLIAYKNKVIKSIEAFFECSLFNILNSLKKEDWITIEDFAKFNLNTGEEVTVKIDTGFKHDGKVYLIDWKTGKPNANVIEQLRTYAMFALKKKWALRVEDIIIVPAYLAAWNDNGEDAIPRLTITMEQIQDQAAIIRQEYPLLSKAHINKDNPTFFPKTDNPKSCTRCFFRDMCSGQKREITDETMPF